MRRKGTEATMAWHEPEPKDDRVHGSGRRIQQGFVVRVKHEEGLSS